MTRLDVGLEHTEAPVACDGPRALLLASREVPLGGVRAMQVHRALPQRELPMVGAWCFLDRFGPQRTRMRVEPHPHIGLQTVTWPFRGDVRHRDSVGSDVIVQRGALNLMTSGRGISHSEYSVGDDEVELDALQLWIALPEVRRHGDASFERHENLPVVQIDVVPDPRHDHAVGAPDAAAWATVVMGEFAGVASPATAHTPLVGAEVHLPAGARVRLPLVRAWEHALLAVDGIVTVDAAGSPELSPGELLYLGIHRDHIDVTSPDGATVFLIGGEPFEDDIVMWWNFVARTHDEIVQARDEWQSGADPEVPAERFGRVPGHGDLRVPAPPLPHVRLTPRRRRV